MKVSNWGNYPVVDAVIHHPSSLEAMKNVITSSESIIARGLGRCYGDSSLNSTIVSTLKMNRLISFDNSTGIVSCEAGISFSELLDAFVPRGWFLPVTPGTKYITVGGAIASDIHGKNHHTSGSFSRHLLSMKIMLGDGSVVDCSRTENEDLFWATCGGMGLTGVILEAVFTLLRIETAYIRQRIIRSKNIHEAFELFEQHKNWTYSVAWIDCLAKGKELGRSALILGEHARSHEIGFNYRDPLSVETSFIIPVPVHLPNFVLNKFTVKVFNELRYTTYRNQESFVEYEPFFYPLDMLDHWNRIYGKRGFSQYQFVIPKDSSHIALPKILQRISESGEGSFLAVLKLFGKQEGLLSFPMEGYTLALDFAISNNTIALFADLDRMVSEYGGRIYLTKDAHMSSTMFEEGYRKKSQFQSVKRKYDTADKFQSLQSKRIGL